MRKNRFREAIDKLFESEVSRLPRFEKMADGQKEEFKLKFVEYMVLELGGMFIESSDIGEKLNIARFLADYSGHKPKVDTQVMVLENPYEQLSDEELEAEERRLLTDGQS
jgi:hypothetical protein